jgi:hypothetical protein
LLQEHAKAHGLGKSDFEDHKTKKLYLGQVEMKSEPDQQILLQ